MLQKMMAISMLDRTGMFAAELARRLPRNDRESWARLAAILRAPTKSELDLTAAVQREMADTARLMQSRRNVRLPDDHYKWSKSFGDPEVRPWWDPAKPWLYRPNYSINRYVARVALGYAVAARPATDFAGALDEHRARARALDPKAWERILLSPATHDHPTFAGFDWTDYVRRMHGYAGFQALIALQVRLRAEGLTEPADVEAALAGPIGQEYLDPFTGKPMQYNRLNRTLGVKVEQKHLSAGARDRATPDGRVEIDL
jgi:hypothetical protein